MTSSSKQPDSARDGTSRERIDALLDEALKESFPASDSSAIGTGTSAIKLEHRERHASDETTPEDEPTPQVDAEGRTISDDTETP
ncbi:MAG: hypothetical protein ABIY56_04285 [Dokdonella sp.]